MREEILNKIKNFTTVCYPEISMITSRKTEFISESTHSFSSPNKITVLSNKLQSALYSINAEQVREVLMHLGHPI